MKTMTKTKALALIITALVSMSANAEHHRKTSIELKIGPAVTIQAPTYVQDDTLKPADVTLTDIQTQVGSATVVRGSQTDFFTSTFTVPVGQTWQVSVKTIYDFQFIDAANLSPLFAASVDILVDGSLMVQGVRLFRLKKVAAGDQVTDMMPVAAMYTVQLSAGTHTIISRVECSATGTVDVSVSNGYFEVLKFKA